MREHISRNQNIMLYTHTHHTHILKFFLVSYFLCSLFLKKKVGGGKYRIVEVILVISKATTEVSNVMANKQFVGQR